MSAPAASQVSWSRGLVTTKGTLAVVNPTAARTEATRIVSSERSTTERAASPPARKSAKAAHCRNIRLRAETATSTASAHQATGATTGSGWRAAPIARLSAARPAVVSQGAGTSDLLRRLPQQERQEREATRDDRERGRLRCRGCATQEPAPGAKEKSDGNEQDDSHGSAASTSCLPEQRDKHQPRYGEQRCFHTVRTLCPAQEQGKSGEQRGER